MYFIYIHTLFCIPIATTQIVEKQIIKGDWFGYWLYMKYVNIRVLLNPKYRIVIQLTDRGFAVSHNSHNRWHFECHHRLPSTGCQSIKCVFIGIFIRYSRYYKDPILYINGFIRIVYNCLSEFNENNRRGDEHIIRRTVNTILYKYII